VVVWAARGALAVRLGGKHKAKDPHQQAALVSGIAMGIEHRASRMKRKRTCLLGPLFFGPLPFGAGASCLALGVCSL
jgi:hypothetical protein